MAPSYHHQPLQKGSSSDSDIASEKPTVEHVSPHREPVTAEPDDVDNINYPEPWKYERWFPGGYAQGRMLKFKKPKTMYTAINLFAGVAIMFYG